MAVKCKEHIDELTVQVWLLYHLVMFRLLPIIDCRSIIAKNSDYRSKISKIDHRKQIISKCEMVKTECTPFELAIIYNMAVPIDLNNNAFNKDTAAVSLERVISPISL